MEKQIEEMANAIHINCHKGLTEDEAKMIAKWCYQEIERRASTVAEEIFAEIDKIVDSFKIEEYSKETEEHIRTSYNGIMIVYCLAELKKKYTEAGE